MTDQARQRLADTRTYARLPCELLGPMGLGEFVEDERTRYAVQHSLFLVGEASFHVPRSVQAQLPEVPWTALRGLRNRLAHAYFMVDLATIHLVVTRDLPELLRVLQQARIDP